MVEVTSPRRIAYAPTRCRRYQLDALADGLVAPPGKAFLRALARFDRNAEVHFLSSIGRWVLYRLTVRAGAPSDDVLTKELPLQGPCGEYRAPGWWLLDVLRTLDQFRDGDSLEAAAKKYLKHLDDEDRKVEECEKRDQADVTNTVVQDLVNYGYGNRKHYT